ncbi:MAG TPA: sugar ABC transporter substrate-binding protein [Promicromonospora sp.]|nr:sugar ABC transporter substrate-binding protein [Promicromonospora sp.]
MGVMTKAGATAVALLTAGALAACSGGSTGASGGDGGPVTLTVWSWDGTVELAVPGFEKEHPDIDVEVVNAGSSSDEYQALDNAIQAGSGVPDLVMFEYFAVPYFAVPGKLADLGPLGADALADDFVPSAWNNVTMDDAVYALPSDYGPAVLFWNQAVFAEAGIDEPPATWDEYYEDAKKIRALGPDHYITQDSNDLFFLLSLIWQAGGRPFQVDGTSVHIDFTDEGTRKAVDFWQKMIDEDLVDTSISAWSDDWNRALNDGTLASQNMGGWLTSTLPERAPDAAGDFRVALMPQWEEGEKVGAENGGSAFGIPEAAENKEAAYAFLEYFTHGEGLQPRVDAGAFVPATSVLESPEFQDVPNPYFGDQETGAVLAEASSIAAVGWQYPPFFEWARSVYPDIATPFYTSGEGSLAEVLRTWQERSVQYGNEQGFQVD